MFNSFQKKFLFLGFYMAIVPLSLRAAASDLAKIYYLT